MVPCCELQLNQTGLTGNLPVGLDSFYSSFILFFRGFVMGLQGLGLATWVLLFPLQLSAMDVAGWSDPQSAASMSVYLKDV